MPELVACALVWLCFFGLSVAIACLPTGVDPS